MELSPFFHSGDCFILQSSTLEYYTGYTEKDINGLVQELNAMIASPPKQLTTIRSKYSHRWVVHCRTRAVAVKFDSVLYYMLQPFHPWLLCLKLDFNSLKLQCTETQCASQYRGFASFIHVLYYKL